jgi:LmbE family N-acetylglucosaminyl deacetylase
MKRILLSALFISIAFCVFGQTAPPSDLATIEQSFKKLDVLGSVLYVAAHPDDENTRLLAYLAQEKHYRTGYLSLTRGDGGQNLIGDEQGSELGLIRTQELLAARRMDGAEQFFSRANDFGFSKGPGETLRIWDREKVLSDVVWVIRKFRPDVIICRFPTTGEGGHGHHTASAILAQEAFTAAADPNRFPEQLKYVKVWQAKRLLWNTFSFGSINTTSPDQFKIDVGVYNPILGKGYGEIAAESRSNHKTQGFGSAKTRGQAFEYFKTILGDAPQTSLMDGVNTTWGRVGAPEIGNEIAGIRKNFDVDHPENSVKDLVGVLDKVEKVQDDYWRAQKTKELSELIAACAGLWFESYSEQPVYGLGDSVSVNTQMIFRSLIKIRLNKIEYPEYGPYKVKPVVSYTSIDNDASNNRLETFSGKFIADHITQPYWLKYPHSIGSYNTDYLDSATLINDDDGGHIEINSTAQKSLPENIPYATQITFNVLGKDITYTRPIDYKYTDPARGELYEPLVIAPPVTANVDAKDYIFNSKQPQTVQVKLKAFTTASGSISIQPVDGWKIIPAKVDFSSKNKGDEWTVDFTVEPTDSKSKTSVFKAEVTANGQKFSLGIKTIAYNHIPTITYFPPAEANLINLDLKTTGKKIGYIAGAGDFVPDALRQVGYDVHMLTENEIMNGDLSGYDAIVTGIRAYNIEKRLAYEEPKLLDYVKNGGDLVVQYNNNNGLVTRDIGPYPFRPVNQRVTDETAKVTFTDPQNAVLNYPNKINDSDFDGWIQERGLYFVSDIDPKYATPLEMNDPGEAPNKGSLIVTDYGKGRFVYTSLDFFRELPAGVPGAYRLFVNLLSRPKNK